MAAFGHPSPLRGVPPPSNDVEPLVDGAEAPVVGGPSSPLPLILGFAAILVVALASGVSLLARRGPDAMPPALVVPRELAADEALPALEWPAPMPAIPPEPPPVAPSPAPRILPEPAAPFPRPLPLVVGPSLAPAVRNPNAPALIVDYSRAPAGSRDAAGNVTTASARAVTTPPSGRRGDLSDDVQKLALDSGGGDQPDRVTASRLERPQSVVVQGTIIPGVLETAIDSDLPGYARATVSLDVLGFDRSMVLIPRGSRLIGRYQSELVPGQSRVFVVWTRLVRPDGASIQLASPVTDTLGRGGLEGRVDRRLFERYGGSALLSTLNAGLTALTPQRGSQVFIGAPAAAIQGSGKSQEVSPVVRVQQGAPIRIFVARDLDFSTVGGRAVPLTAAIAGQ